jgi:hypothetical protein
MQLKTPEANSMKSPCSITETILTWFTDINITHSSQQGVRGSVVVKALCYKPEGRRFNS